MRGDDAKFFGGMFAIWIVGLILAFAFWGGLIYVAVKLLQNAGAF